MCLFFLGGGGVSEFSNHIDIQNYRMSQLQIFKPKEGSNETNFRVPYPLASGTITSLM